MKNQYTEIKGDLIQLARQGKFDVIAHGCNCFCRMGAGIAVAMAKEFGCSSFKLEDKLYQGSINKIGQVDYQLLHYETGKGWTKYPDIDGTKITHSLHVVNCYTQYGYGNPNGDLDYEALTLCMRKLGGIFHGKHIGLPQIGAGLAKGDWDRIKAIIQQELRFCEVTVVIYDKN